MTTYIVITQFGQYGDANIHLETADLEEAKKMAKMLSRTDGKDAHTFITIKDEWKNGNYDEIEFDA